MSMPPEWVERLFERLLAVYGNGLTRMWEGIDPALVKAAWCDELSSIRPDSIRYALAHLPEDRPPTVLQFRRLCASAPEPVTPRLPAPPTNPEAAKRVREIGVQIGASNPKAWAHALRKREQYCEVLTPFQRAAWREALAGEQA